MAPPWLPIAATTNGFAPQFAEHVERGADHRLQVGDAAAADADGDAHARLDALRQIGCVPEPADFAGHVGDARLVEHLPNGSDHRKVGHAGHSSDQRRLAAKHACKQLRWNPGMLECGTSVQRTVTWRFTQCDPGPSIGERS